MSGIIFCLIPSVIPSAERGKQPHVVHLFTWEQQQHAACALWTCQQQQHISNKTSRPPTQFSSSVPCKKWSRMCRETMQYSATEPQSSLTRKSAECRCNKNKTHTNLKLNTFIRFRLKYDAYFIKFHSLSPQILLLWLIEVDIKTWQQQRRLIWQMGTIHPQTHTPADTQTCTPIHVRAMT